MIREIIELLHFQEWYGISENIHIAKGGYRYPRTFKEIFKNSYRWLLRKQ
jgi:hypothetical protein